MRRILVFLFACSAAAWGQSYQGGIRGAVLDPSSAAAAGAKVSLIDVETNSARLTRTNAAGEYVFASAQPSTYRLVVTADGFSNFEHTGIIIGTQEFVTLDVKLQLGQVQNSVVVSDELPLLETSNASTGQVLDRQKLVDLPNLGRNPFMLAKITQNATNVGDPRFNRMQDQNGSSALSIAGGLVGGNNYLLDGIPITDSTNRAVIIPSIESVQEVKIQTNTYDAEIGRTSGGVFNTYLKSGSNQYHGSAFGSLRQPEWQANTFFNNRNGVAREEQPYKTYGGSLGGAIRIPHIYDGRNRTFFFAGTEGYRQTSARSQEAALPTALEVAGDFSKTVSRSGGIQQIYDPLTTRSDGAGGFIRTLFPGNVIPQDRINVTGRAIASYYPAPARQPLFYGGNDTGQTSSLYDRADQRTIKMDHQVMNWWRASASYLHYRSREPSAQWFSGPATSASVTLRAVDATQISNVLTPDASTVINIRYGFNRFPNVSRPLVEGFDQRTLRFSDAFLSQIQFPGFPFISMQNMQSLGNIANSETVYSSRSFLVSAARLVRRHSLKSGFDFRRVNNAGIQAAASQGFFTFSDTFTRATPLRATAGTGADLASLLLGYSASGGVVSATKLYQWIDYWAGFVHDDFRLNSRLTVNFGLRWEFESGLHARDNALIVGFNRDVTSPIPLSQAGAVAPKGGLMYAGVNGNPATTANPNHNKFAPRFGAAWAVSPKMTIRGGYGLFWGPVPYDLQNTLGFSQTTIYLASADGNATPAGILNNPFPNGIQKPTGNSLGLLTGVGANLAVIDQRQRSPYTHQYSFDIQRQLPGNINLSIGYVGSYSPRLVMNSGINANQLDPKHMALGSQLLRTVPNPYFQAGGNGFLGGATVTTAQSLLPFPQFTSINTSSDVDHARYNSMVLKGQKRMRNGLTFVSTWTWSKMMDASFAGVANALGSDGGVQNGYDLASEYTLSYVHTPHRWTSAVTYELPFGKGRRFAPPSRALDLAIGGWSVNVVTAFQSGFPLAVTQQSNNNSSIGAGQRPTATGISPVTPGSLTQRIDGYLNPAAFSQTPAFTFGNLGRSISMRGPGEANWDFSIFKTYAFRERWKAQFRAEAYNGLNTPHFQRPNLAVGAASFGVISSQANFPRMLQLGIRLFF